MREAIIINARVNLAISSGPIEYVCFAVCQAHAVHAEPPMSTETHVNTGDCRDMSCIGSGKERQRRLNRNLALARKKKLGA